MAAEGLVRTEKKFHGQVVELTLDGPPANILTLRMMEALEREILKETENPKLKLFTITGTGRHFSYGARVEEHLPDVVGKMLPIFHRMIGTILECPVPTLAKVSGLCLGGGFELVLACSLVYADETAEFGVPEIQLGVFPPVAAALLPAELPAHLASYLILTGDKVGAKILAQHGLVNHVAFAGSLESDVAEFVEKRILPKSASSLRLAHKAIQIARVRRYRDLIGTLEQLYLKDLMATHDGVEGIRAFVEKRSPRW